MPCPCSQVSRRSLWKALVLAGCRSCAYACTLRHCLSPWSFMFPACAAACNMPADMSMPRGCPAAAVKSATHTVLVALALTVALWWRLAPEHNRSRSWSSMLKVALVCGPPCSYCFTLCESTSFLVKPLRSRLGLPHCFTSLISCVLCDLIMTGQTHASWKLFWFAKPQSLMLTEEIDEAHAAPPIASCGQPMAERFAL